MWYVILLSFCYRFVTFLGNLHSREIRNDTDSHDERKMGTKKAANQNRTGDLILTKDAHYRLCYSSLYRFDPLRERSQFALAFDDLVNLVVQFIDIDAFARVFRGDVIGDREVVIGLRDLVARREPREIRLFGTRSVFAAAFHIYLYHNHIQEMHN